MSKKIFIVGAGVGGLATAVRLAKKGFNVEVHEKLTECGGRAHLIEDKGFKFDTGPSFVMMPDFFNEFFTSCGEDISDHLDLKMLDKHYKIFYPDGDTLTVYSDNKKTEEELEKIEKGSSKAYVRFLKDVAVMYNEVEGLFHKCYSPFEVLNPAYWPLLATLKLGKSYWKLAKEYFKSDELCYAFTFEAMFIGVSPFSAPSFYSVIAYTDHVHKIFHPMGGMYEIPRAMESMAKKLGVRFKYNSEIENIEKKGKKFILTAKEGDYEADRVVINADYSYAKENILKQNIPEFDYSCSVYLIYWGMKKKIANLEHHNLFFAKDLKANMNNIFKDKIVPDDFSFYVHVPTVTDPSLAPKGKDILYILVPVPNLDGTDNDFSRHEGKIRKVIVDKVNALCGENIEDLIEVEHKFYPADFTSRYNIKNGATFGLSHTLMQSGFLRPQNRDGKIKGLYFVGASTQPGGGLPPVIASSRIAADLIINEQNK